MGIQDRDWYREAYRERERALQKEALNRRAQEAKNRSELARLVNNRTTKATPIYTVAKGLALLIALCLATYGLLALVRDFR